MKTWSILEVFGVREAPKDDSERGESGEDRRKGELAAAARAGNPLAIPSKGSTGGGEHRFSSVSGVPKKSATPLGTGKGVVNRVPAGSSKLKGGGQRALDMDAPDDATPQSRKGPTPLTKPGYKGSFVGQVWQPTGQTQKWSNKYFDVNKGGDSRASGERMAKRPEALYWDGNDWVTKPHFVMGKRGEAPPTQPAKGPESGTMTPLPPSRDEYDQRAKKEIQRIMTRGSRDREEAIKAANAAYDEYDRKYAEYSRSTGKPAQKIERLPWVSGEKPRAASPAAPKKGGTYSSWDDVPDSQRREIQKYLSSQDKPAGVPPKPASSASPAPGGTETPRPTSNPTPSGAPWRALQRMTGGDKESDEDVLARMRARHGMPPKKEGADEDLDEKHVGFAKLKRSLSHEKGVHDPAALAASIGREKLGSAEMARRSAAGRKKKG